MWYVMQVMGGKEKRVRELVRKLVDGSLVDECFVPQYEVMKRIRGEWRKRAEVLLPGYLFVITSQPARLHEALRAVPAFTKLLGSNDAFIPLSDQEIAFINAFAVPGRRVVEMSTGVIEGDEVVVLNGPLMNQVGLIEKVDRHKRMAYLVFDMMGRRMTVKVGLEIVQKRT